MDIYQLLDAVRSTRAPRGKASERNELLAECKRHKADMDFFIILMQGSRDSTYNGVYPETIGVAYDRAIAKTAKLHKQAQKLLGI